MAELIDRNDTLKIICDTIALYGTGTRVESEILSIVSKIPISEVKTARWIPVTERLPDSGGLCFVTFVSGEVATAYFNGKTRRFCFQDVKAWMPLPEAYRGLNERSE